MNASGIVSVFLGPVHISAITYGHIEIAIPVKFHATGKVSAAVGAGQSFEYHFNVGKAITTQPRTSHAGGHTVPVSVGVAQE